MIEGDFPLKGAPALEALAEAYDKCETCEALCETRKRPVFGSGSADARIMVIAEAPGPQEDQEGEPFVGDAGRLIMDLLAHAWPQDARLSDIRDCDGDDEYFGRLRDFLDDYVFWTNIILCWPGEDNRDPRPAEKKACRDRLVRTIYAIDPTVIIGLGKVACGALLGSTVQITQKRGHIFDVDIPSPATGEAIRYPMLALLNPSFLLRRGDQDLIKRKRGNSYKTLEDLKWLVELLQLHHQTVHDTDFPMEFNDE